MSLDIDHANFADLKAMDPEDVIARTGCSFDEAKEQYLVAVWGQNYCVDLKKNDVYPENSGPGANPETDSGAGSGKPGHKTYNEYFYLFILYYLMKSKNILPKKEWVSQKDIPGGAAFFRGPHTIPVDVIIKGVKDNLDLFKGVCEKSGGIPIELADAAFMFQITPTIHVAVLYWQGDEDFPSDAALLFDRTIEEQLPLDIIYALAVEICHALGRG